MIEDLTGEKHGRCVAMEMRQFLFLILSIPSV